MPTSPEWSDLVHEHRTQVMGHLWLDLLDRVIRSATPRYPPIVYSETGEWNDHGRENLIQDVVVHQLLGQGQLAYIVDTATSTDTARALLHRVVRRTLAHTRRRTVVDNLLDRCRAIHTFSRSAGAGVSDELVVEVARHIASVPKLRIHTEQRAPAIYTAESLEQILATVAAHLGVEFSERDLARILEHVLTSYLPSSLEESDARARDTTAEFTPEQEAVVSDVLSHLLDTMNTEQRTVVALKLTDHSDTEVAARLGVSRPTAAKRFREAITVIEAALSDLPGHLQDAVLSELPTLLDLDPPERTLATD
jgi:AcrR family transcriptional regulator